MSFIIYNFLSLFFNFIVILGLVTSHKSFACSLQKKRKRSFGEEKLPTSWDDMKTVPEQFLKSYSGEDFLVMNKSINEAGARIMGFVTPSLMVVLKKTDDISIDGTFDITKWTLFAQVRYSFFLFSSI